MRAMEWRRLRSVLLNPNGPATKEESGVQISPPATVNNHLGSANLGSALIPHQHTRAPEVQTTGETTPVQQIVYAESLTTSGGSNA